MYISTSHDFTPPQAVTVSFELAEGQSADKLHYGLQSAFEFAERSQSDFATINQQIGPNGNFGVTPLKAFVDLEQISREGVERGENVAVDYHPIAAQQGFWLGRIGLEEFLEDDGSLVLGQERLIPETDAIAGWMIVNWGSMTQGADRGVSFDGAVTFSDEVSNADIIDSVINFKLLTSFNKR